MLNNGNGALLNETPKRTPHTTLTINSRSTSLTLLSIAAACFILHIAAGLFFLQTGEARGGRFEYLWRFDMGTEISLPTWWSQTQLLIPAGLFFLIARSATQHQRYWYALAALFVFVSIDEGASLHEPMANIARLLINVPLVGPLAGAWYLPVGLIVIILILVFTRFFFTLPTHTKIGFAAAFIVFIAGAVGLEMYAADFITNGGEYESKRYLLMCGIEELCELTGVVILIHTLISYLATHAPQHGSTLFAFTQTKRASNARSDESDPHAAHRAR